VAPHDRAAIGRSATAVAVHGADVYVLGGVSDSGILTSWYAPRPIVMDTWESPRDHYNSTTRHCGAPITMIKLLLTIAMLRPMNLR